MLNSPNLVIHVAGTLLNTTAIEKMGQDFALYKNGLTPSLLRCADAVEKERNQVLREWITALMQVRCPKCIR